MTALHLLGTVGYHPSQSRHTTCLMIPEDGIVLDAGTAFFRVRDHLKTSNLDIFLTHAHLDHSCGLTFLLDVLWNKPVKSVTLHARASDITAVTTLLFNTPLFPLKFTYGLKTLEPEFGLGKWAIRTRNQRHPGGSIGYRFESGASSFAFITDTTADPTDREAVEFVQGVDLLIHECNFPDEMLQLAIDSGHSTGSAVGEFAKAADVKRLVLTHCSPLCEAPMLERIRTQAAKAFSGCQWATDEMILEF